METTLFDFKKKSFLISFLFVVTHFLFLLCTVLSSTNDVYKYVALKLLSFGFGGAYNAHVKNPMQIICKLISLYLYLLETETTTTHKQKTNSNSNSTPTLPFLFPCFVCFWGPFWCAYIGDLDQVGGKRKGCLLLSSAFFSLLFLFTQVRTSRRQKKE
jgi:hypothetical protein